MVAVLPGSREPSGSQSGSARRTYRSHQLQFTTSRLDVSAAAWIILLSRSGEIGKGLVAMALGLLGLKVGMTQVYDDKGRIAPVTVLQLGPCPVLQVRNQERDGYDAVQVGFLDKPRRKATRGERGHVSV